MEWNTPHAHAVVEQQINSEIILCCTMTVLSDYIVGQRKLILYQHIYIQSNDIL